VCRIAPASLAEQREHHETIRLMAWRFSVRPRPRNSAANLSCCAETHRSTDAARGCLPSAATAPTRRVGVCLPWVSAFRVGVCLPLVADRGFCSFAHLALLVSRGAHAVIRMHQRQLVDFTPKRPYVRSHDKTARKGLSRSRWLRQLGVMDQLVEWFKLQRKPNWMSQEKFAALPESLILREIRYDIGRPGFRTQTVTLVTTLCDNDLYTVEALADLYAARWRVEQNLKHLKQTMKMDVLRRKTVDGVLKEFAIFGIVYNLVRIVMMKAAIRQGVDVEQIRFIDALRWLCQMKLEGLPQLVVNPRWPGRFEPRVRKRRPKEYPLMKKPRSELRKILLQQPVAA
jgi:hypothetical protein